MKKIFLFLVAAITSLVSFSQIVPGYLRYDSIYCEKNAGVGNSELIIKNGTRNTLGFLQNFGGGRTRFVPPLTQLNDSTWKIGDHDTLKLFPSTFSGTSYTFNGGLANSGGSVHVASGALIGSPAWSLSGTQLFSTIWASGDNAFGVVVNGFTQRTHLTYLSLTQSSLIQSYNGVAWLSDSSRTTGESWGVQADSTQLKLYANVGSTYNRLLLTTGTSFGFKFLSNLGGYTFPRGTPSTGNVLIADGSGNYVHTTPPWGTGTVINFSAGDLAPLFTTNEATTTTTPALTFGLSTAGANTYFGNATGSTGSPSYTSAGSLTKTDDANVTLTLGGNATTSLLRSASITAGWTGQLSIARGGTGLSSLGSAYQRLRVNAAGTALEYFTPTATQGIKYDGIANFKLGDTAGLSTHNPNMTEAREIISQGSDPWGVVYKFNENGSFAASTYPDTTSFTYGGTTGTYARFDLSAEESIFSASARDLTRHGNTYFELAPNQSTYYARNLDIAGTNNYGTLKGGMQFDSVGTRLNIHLTNATGDMWYQDASGYMQRLAIGTNGYFLSIASGIPVWVASPAGLSSTLTSGHIYVGNGSNVATDVALSGDATLVSTGAITLATVNSNVGSFGSSTAIPSFTVNAKGLITAASTNVVIAPAGTLTGTTLNSTVATSSLTTVGTLIGGATGSGFTLAMGSSTVTGALTETHGGTNQTTYTTGDILYSSASNTLSKLAGVATGNALISGGVATAPSWGKIDLTAHVTGVLPVANGGTSFSSYTTGDLVQASGSGTLSKLNAVATGNVLLSGGTSTISSWGKVGLTTHVSGTLPIANGGTNSTAALSNNRVMVSSGSAIVEAAAITASRLLVSDANGIPTHTSVTTTEAGYLAGATSNIQTQIGNLQPKITTQIISYSDASLTWTFTGSAPTGPTDSIRVHRDPITGFTTLIINLDYTGAGSACTKVTCTLPGTIPTPVGWGKTIAANTLLGQGRWSTGTTNAPTTPISGDAWLRNNGSGSYEVATSAVSSGNYKFAYITITYYSIL